MHHVHVNGLTMNITKNRTQRLYQHSLNTTSPSTSQVTIVCCCLYTFSCPSYSDTLLFESGVYFSPHFRLSNYYHIAENFWEGKPSRISMFRGYLRKFSRQNSRAWSFGGTSEQPAKVLSMKIFFPPTCESFFPQKFPTIWHYMVFKGGVWLKKYNICMHSIQQWTVHNLLTHACTWYYIIIMSITTPQDAHKRLVLQVYVSWVEHFRVQCYIQR